MFQQAISTLGQLDGQYQMKTKILAVVRQVKKMEFSQSSGKPKQSLYLTDESGEDSWVTIIGKFDALDDSSLGKQYEFLVWPYKADQSPKTTLYCWINRQVPQQQSQGSPQRPQTPPRGIKPPPGIDVQSQIMDMAERFLVAIEQLSFPNAVTPMRPTQPSGPNPDWVGDNPETPDDDLAF